LASNVAGCDGASPRFLEIGPLPHPYNAEGKEKEQKLKETGTKI
jgi:hypothetical protein